MGELNQRLCSVEDLQSQALQQGKQILEAEELNQCLRCVEELQGIAADSLSLLLQDAQARADGAKSSEPSPEWSSPSYNRKAPQTNSTGPEDTHASYRASRASSGEKFNAI